MALRLRPEMQLPVHMMAPSVFGTEQTRFTSLFFHTVGDRMEMGYVWFDVASGNTGPAEVPIAIRCQLRLDVNRQLTPPISSSRLIDALLKWDAALVAPGVVQPSAPDDAER